VDSCKSIGTTIHINQAIALADQAFRSLEEIPKADAESDLLEYLKLKLAHAQKKPVRGEIEGIPY
jgi:hypothetical protein